jgi:alkanesulfonate monooxygenase SsuD/methylene tetrahydromethanopterin reductase-like flavin-dependent oxidoreductase (luciferase family)
MPFPTPPRQLPIHLAALGSHAVALAGELADGWIAVHCPPEYMAAARPWLQEGAARTGRSLSSFTTSAAVLCCVDDDEELARDLVRPVLALYIGGMGSRSTNFFNRLAVRLGFADAAAAARDAYFSGDIPKAIAAVDDKVVDAMAICGPESHVRARLTAYRDAGVDAVIAGFAVPSLPDQIGQIEAIGSIMSTLP